MPIALADWVLVAASDPELEAMPENGAGFFVVRGLREDGGDARFDWHRGEVVTKNPDLPTTRKMIELAKQLDAQVQGDDGELYPSGDDYVRHARGLDPTDRPASGAGALLATVGVVFTAIGLLRLVFLVVIFGAFIAIGTTLARVIGAVLLAVVVLWVVREVRKREARPAQRS